MKNKLIALTTCATLFLAGAMSLTACGEGTPPAGDTVSLTVWGPEAQQDSLKAMVRLFQEANPDKTYNISVGVCSEGDAYDNVSKDPAAAADVYAYANDQITNLVRIGALAQVGGQYLSSVTSDNGAGAVNSAMVGGKCYGYPYSADNGYFLYYDKSVVSAEQATTLEGLISAAQSKGKKIAWALDDAWYVAGFFFTAGASYDVTYNADGTEQSIACDFDGEKGIVAAKAMAKLASSTAFAGKGTNNDTIVAGFGDGTLAAGVTGTWNATAIQEKLGANYAACKLPTVTVDGQSLQLSSFAGYKLYGVNATSKNIGESHKLAAFLSSEAMQVKRLTESGIGPSNVVAATNPAIESNLALKALAEQNKHAVAQTAVPANFWDPTKAFGIAIVDGLSEANYQAELTKMGNLIRTIKTN